MSHCEDGIFLFSGLYNGVVMSTLYMDHSSTWVSNDRNDMEKDITVLETSIRIRHSMTDECDM